MKLFKALFIAVALLVSSATLAITDEDQVALSEAIASGDAATVKKMLDGGLVDVKEKAFAWSWLQVAANKNHLPVVKLFVEAGSEMNYKHPLTKMTAVALATYNNNLEMVEYLISKGADPNIKMRGNVSLVRMARDMGNNEMVDLLMKLGAKDDGCKEEKCL